MSPRGALVVFAKAPSAGRVKTRMVPPLSSEEARGLYESLLADVLEVSAGAGEELGLEPVVAVDPAEAVGDVAVAAPTAFRVVGQRGADLGSRMQWALEEAAAGGATPVLLRGSDSPTLDSPLIAEAIGALHAADLVVCPDRDGGYSLVGVRRPVTDVFTHPMSTPTVLRDTLARARARGLRTCELRARFDLDRIEDLRWLAEARQREPSLPCPRTLSYLDEHDLWRLGDPAATRVGARGARGRNDTEG